MDKKSENTRRAIIDTARQLFAERSVRAVTMNDIATACHRSRRTIYAYFPNKEEVYHAVIEMEANTLLKQVQSVTGRNLPPQQRIAEYILAHLEAVKTAVERNGGLRSDFFRNIYEVERARKRVDVQELAILRKTLEEGIETGDFKPMNVDLTATLIYYATKGVELPYIRRTGMDDFYLYKRETVRFILSCLSR